MTSYRTNISPLPAHRRYHPTDEASDGTLPEDGDVEKERSTTRADRDRLYRKRRREGVLVVGQFELSRDALDFLIGRGVFSESDLQDGRSAAEAVKKYFNQLTASRRAW